MTDNIMDYTPATPEPFCPKPLSRYVDVRPCAGCGTDVVWDQAHRVETADGKTYNLCDTCCPNCFGGEGNGPGESS